MQDTNNDVTGQVAPQDTDGEGEKRSEKRYQDLANKVATTAREKEELTAQHAKEKTELEAKLKEQEFKLGLSEVISKYPQAKEFEADIRDKHSKGYALEDAVVSTLASKGKLVTPEEQIQQTRTQVTGGSADVTVTTSRGDDPTFGGDRAKMREELVRLEQQGEVGLRF